MVVHRLRVEMLPERISKDKRLVLLCRGAPCRPQITGTQPVFHLLHLAAFQYLHNIRSGCNHADFIVFQRRKLKPSVRLRPLLELLTDGDTPRFKIYAVPRQARSFRFTQPGKHDHLEDVAVLVPLGFGEKRPYLFVRQRYDLLFLHARQRHTVARIQFQITQLHSDGKRLCQNAVNVADRLCGEREVFRYRLSFFVLVNDCPPALLELIIEMLYLLRRQL